MFRPVAHGPGTLAVRAALPLAPGRFAAERGFSPCLTGMGPTSGEALSLRRARVRLWRRPSRGALKGITLAS